MTKKIKIRDPDVTLITVYTSNDSAECDLVRNILLDHGIDCQLSGEGQAGFSGIMEIGVVVRSTHAAEATEIVNIHHPIRAGVSKPKEG